MDLIAAQYALVNGGLFEAKDLKHFFEQNYTGLNEAKTWLLNHVCKHT